MTSTLTHNIQLTGLTKSYGSVAAVRGVDLSIAAGETIALLGPNGAGKSTTIDMLLGLQDPDAGSARVFGMTPAQAVASGAVGAMMQTGGLIGGLTVRELILSNGAGHRQVVGAPEQIADTIEHWFVNRAADGFNLSGDVFPSGLEAFVDHVVPELRRRGLFRHEYEGTTLRDHLGLPRPESLYAHRLDIVAVGAVN